MIKPKATLYSTVFPGVRTKFGVINVGRTYLIEHLSGRKEVYVVDSIPKARMLGYVIEVGIEKLVDITNSKLAKELYD